MTAALPTHDLADAQLWRQLATVATLYSRRRPHLRDEMESAVGLGLAKALNEWRPGGGMTLRSYATLLAQRECQTALAADRPKGFRSKGSGEGPAVVSLEGMAEARELDPRELVADNGPRPEVVVERHELAEVGAAALGRDAGVVARWTEGEGVVEIAASLGVSKQAVAQRIDRAIVRAKKAMDRATRPRDAGAA